MRTLLRATVLGMGLALLWGHGAVDALTGLDGRWYPTYRRQMVRWVQQVLVSREALPGPPTGRMDGHTMEALKRFQAQMGLHPSGVPTPLTRRALRAVAPSVRGPGEPAFRGAATVVGQVGAVRITHVVPPRRGVPQEFQRRVNVKDVIETGVDGKAFLELDDGSRLVLGPNSRLQVHDFVSSPGEREKSILLEASRGVLRFVARVRAEATTEIRIQAPTAFAAVRGTDWMMRVEADTMALFVEEGSVAVMNIGPNAKQVVVGRKQGTEVGAGKQPTDPTSWSPERQEALRRAVEYP